MPTPCYVSISGKTQGHITAGAYTADSVGNIYTEGHEDEMLVQEVKHVVAIPTDLQSGQPSGQRTHKPLVLTVALNKAIPLLYNALSAGEVLSTVDLKWYRTSIEGKQEHYFSTVLTDAIVTGINLHMPHCLDETQSGFSQLVDISFSYRKINWEHLIAGTSGSDDWRVVQ